MNQKNLIILIGVTFVLFGIYFLTVPSSAPRSDLATTPLFEGTRGESVAGVTLEQGAEKLELVLRDGLWRVPARGGYQADASKIRAFLLKLFDLDVSQRVPADAKSAERLGVSDEALKRGMGHLTLMDASGKQIAGLRLGEARKGKDRSGPNPASGQYVRRDGEDAVYLIANPVTLNLAPENWIDVNLVNILPGALHSIVQLKRGENNENVEFELVRSGESDKSGLPNFTSTAPIPAGKAIQETVVTQVRSALENLRISDIKAPDAAELKDLKFDTLSKYKTNSGLVYQIESAEKEQKIYAKISVSFDSDLAKLAKEANEKAAAAAVVPSPAPTPSSTEGGASPSPTPTPSPLPKPVEIKISDETEAKKLSDQFANWVYEIPSYSGRKLRYSLSDLTEPPPPAPESAGEFMPHAH